MPGSSDAWVHIRQTLSRFSGHMWISAQHNNCIIGLMKNAERRMQNEEIMMSSDMCALCGGKVREGVTELVMKI